MAEDVGARLSALVADGALRPDPYQIEAAEALDRVLDAIRQEPPRRRLGRLARLLHLRGGKDEPPRGLYLHGGVGRGKTMLMDIFFAALPETAKRRVHFNEFMTDVHDRIIRQREARRQGRDFEDDPIQPVARDLAAEARVLCFDEFAVNDIADAMILSRLFSHLFARGVVLVATSNVAPWDLYRDGLNRGLFLPFIDLLESRCDVLALEGALDYRQMPLADMPNYVTPLGAAADAAMDKAWAAAIAGQTARPTTFRVMGRLIEVPTAAGDAARFTFADICEKPLGARDYLALSQQYTTIFIDRIPVLGIAQRNEAKRFILLIDTLYDRGNRLFVSAASEPDRLYSGGVGTETFEWARTASRLGEMRSADWPQRP